MSLSLSSGPCQVRHSILLVVSLCGLQLLLPIATSYVLMVCDARVDQQDALARLRFYPLCGNIAACSNRCCKPDSTPNVGVITARRPLWSRANDERMKT